MNRDPPGMLVERCAHCGWVETFRRQGNAFSFHGRARAASTAHARECRKRPRAPGEVYEYRVYDAKGARTETILALPYLQADAVRAALQAASLDAPSATLRRLPTRADYCYGPWILKPVRRKK